MRVFPYAVLVVVAGCATVHPPEVTPPPLPLLPSSAVEEAPAPALPLEERGLLMDSEPRWPAENEIHVIKKAVKRATVTPALVGFDRGMLVYPYRPYAVYRVKVPFRGSLHIQLQPGEEIRLVGGLRPEDWFVQREDAPTTLEASHLALTPKEAHLEGRMMLVTSKGVYYLDVRSDESTGLYGVSWRHPPNVAR
jgi:type IV secretory pathway VirB9-like protein